jgi:hypothetical protein
VRLPIHRPPDHGEDEADGTDDEEQRPPAPRAQQPEQRGAEERQSYVFTNRVYAGRPRTLLTREPDADDAAVGRKTRRLADTQAKAKSDKSGETRGETLQQREDRPQSDGREIGEPAAEPVEKHAAGNLRHDIRPGKRREHHAHNGCIDAELLRHRRSGNPEHRAIEVVD